MALQVNLATATVELVLDTRRFYRELARAHSSLTRFQQTYTVTLMVNAAPAQARLNLVRQQLQSLQQQARLRLSASGGGGGGGGFGGFGGPGFLSGVWTGAGLPYAANPQMMAGQLVGGGAVAAVQTAIRMQSSMASLRRVGGFVAEEAEGLKQRLFQSSIHQPGVSIEDLMTIAESGARAGVRGGPQGIAAYAEDVAMVRNAVGDMPTEELANRMVQVLNVFGEGTDKVKNFGSALVAMDQASTATARDILDVTTRLSGTSRQIGLTIPQTVALAATLKNVGLSNEVAGSSLSQILRKMGSTSERFAEQIGVNAKAFADAYRKDPMIALQMVINKLKELDDTVEGQEFIDSLGLRGIRVGGALQQLSSKFGDIEPLTQQAAAETNTLAALKAAQSLKAETAETALIKFQNSLTILADEVGKQVLPGLTDLTNTMTALTVATAKGKDGFQALMASMLLGANNMASAVGVHMLTPEDEGNAKSWITRLMERTLYGRSFTEGEKPLPTQPGGMAAHMSDLKPIAGLNRGALGGAILGAFGGGVEGGLGAGGALLAGMFPDAPDDLAKASFGRAAVMNRSPLGGAVLGGFGGGIEASLAGAAAMAGQTAAGVAGGGGAVFQEAGRRLWNGMAVAGEMRGGLLGIGARAAGLGLGKVARDAEKGEKARLGMDFRAGFDASSLSQRIQEAILDQDKQRHAEQTAKNTSEAIPLLAGIKAAVEKGAGGVVGALFGR